MWSKCPNHCPCVLHWEHTVAVCLWCKAFLCLWSRAAVGVPCLSVQPSPCSCLAVSCSWGQGMVCSLWLAHAASLLVTPGQLWPLTALPEVCSHRGSMPESVPQRQHGQSCSAISCFCFQGSCVWFWKGCGPLCKLVLPLHLVLMCETLSFVLQTCGCWHGPAFMFRDLLAVKWKHSVLNNGWLIARALPEGQMRPRARCTMLLMQAVCTAWLWPKNWPCLCCIWWCCFSFNIQIIIGLVSKVKGWFVCICYGNWCLSLRFHGLLWFWRNFHACEWLG